MCPLLLFLLHPSPPTPSLSPLLVGEPSPASFPAARLWRPTSSSRSPVCSQLQEAGGWGPRVLGFLAGDSGPQVSDTRAMAWPGDAKRGQILDPDELCSKETRPQFQSQPWLPSQSPDVTVSYSSSPSCLQTASWTSAPCQETGPAERHLLCRLREHSGIGPPDMLCLQQPISPQLDSSLHSPFQTFCCPL